MVSPSQLDGKARRRRTYRRRAIVLVDVVSVSTYMSLVEEGGLKSPIPCPDGCKDGKWGRHSSFERQWVDYDCVVYDIVIVRVCCSRCGGVWSLFPAFVWYRFRFCHRLMQSVCWKVVEGDRPASVAEGLLGHLSPIVKERGQYRIPAESTIRSWMEWMGQKCLEQPLRWTLSLIAERSAEAARAVLPEWKVGSGLPPTVKRRKRVKRVLRVCAVLDAVTKRCTPCTDLFRRAPNQLRDWGRVLFRERRFILARPP